MLAYRPAPVQITYLGLPATTGLPFIDYVIADRYLIPEAERRNYYSEKPLSCRTSIRSATASASTRRRPHARPAACPKHAFVFCSLQQQLQDHAGGVPHLDEASCSRVPGSVLWMLADNPWAQENLQARGAGTRHRRDRLIFAGHVRCPRTTWPAMQWPTSSSTAYPFNGGTTANDALWMGLPVLTRSGQHLCLAYGRSPP
jgi:predicted O-linked N-acetylglucosamine transferase (SPINDLY family)